MGIGHQYNWAEGSRAIEARRGAARMRSATARFEQHELYMRLFQSQLLAMLSMLGVEDPDGELARG